MRRLTFTFRDGTIELISQQQVEMRMPAKTSPRGGQAQPAFWCELQDADSEVLYRFAAEDPIPTDVEVFSDDPERTIERAPHPPSEGVFSLLVPEIEDAAEIVLMRSAAAAGDEPGAARETAAGVEVGRFELTKE